MKACLQREEEEEVEGEERGREQVSEQGRDVYTPLIQGSVQNSEVSIISGADRITKISINAP